MCVCECACVSVCVCERERERVCVCVCVCLVEAKVDSPGNCCVRVAPLVTGLDLLTATGPGYDVPKLLVACFLCIEDRWLHAPGLYRHAGYGDAPISCACACVCVCVSLSVSLSLSLYLSLPFPPSPMSRCTLRAT